MPEVSPMESSDSLLDLSREATRECAPLLQRCKETFRLTSGEIEVLLLALAVELSPAIGARFGQVHGDPQRRRPTIASLLAVLANTSSDPPTIATLGVGGHLHRTGLIEIVGDGPFPDRVVRIPDMFWPRLAGIGDIAPFPVSKHESDALRGLILHEDTRAELAALMDRTRVAAASQAFVCIAGRAGSGRETLARASANELGYASLVAPAGLVEDPAVLPHLAREAAWFLAALVVIGAPSPAALTRVAAEISTPVILVVEDLAAADAVLLGRRWRADVHVIPLGADERERLWRQQLFEAKLTADVDLRRLAERFPLGPGRIVTAASAARRAAHGRAITREDVRAACRRGGGPTSGLAQRLEADASFEELIVPNATRRELELATAWAGRAASVFHPTGIGRRVRGHEGLVCLFHGPPGTGKTMAARVIARSIDADLLRIDLSQLVNKYIGETEKNLDRVFDEAEAMGAVLFFDEADALFGKRSEVKDAHDRYANIETAFLLQRLEVHRGVCILASNLRQNLDDAFTRRIHVSAEFPAPGREERRRIWELQFPADCLAPDVDMALLADRANLTGGDIRNAAATAAMLAAGNGRHVSMDHLVIGAWRELRKSGRLVSTDIFGPWKDALHEYVRGDVVVEGIEPRPRL